MKELSSSFNGRTAPNGDNHVRRHFDGADRERIVETLDGAFRRVAPLTAVALALASGCGRSHDPAPPAIERETRTLAFSSQHEGSVPPGWSVERTGSGEGSAWRVVADESSPSGTGYALAQTAESPRSMFNLCVLAEGRYADLKLRVGLKAVEGNVDQGGGLVWRLIDANNYYVCRFNPLENNLRIYKVIAGKREQLASVDVELAAGRWHTMTATMQDNLIVCELNGTRLSVRDDTLTDAGRIGLWTKADACTYFDTLSVTGVEAAAADESQVAVEDRDAKHRNLTTDARTVLKQQKETAHGPAQKTVDRFRCPLAGAGGYRLRKRPRR